MKVNYETLDKLYNQIGNLRKKAINKIIWLLKEIGGEVVITNQLAIELQEYFLTPEICCQGIDDNGVATTASIYKIYYDKKDKKVYINFWVNNKSFEIKNCPYDDILFLIEVLLYIKENK